MFAFSVFFILSTSTKLTSVLWKPHSWIQHIINTFVHRDVYANIKSHWSLYVVTAKNRADDTYIYCACWLNIITWTLAIPVFRELLLLLLSVESRLFQAVRDCVFLGQPILLQLEMSQYNVFCANYKHCHNLLPIMLHYIFVQSTTWLLQCAVCSRQFAVGLIVKLAVEISDGMALSALFL